jgi:hypothetical protein
MSRGTRVWLCIVAVVLVLAAIGIVFDVVIDGSKRSRKKSLTHYINI